MEPPKAQLASLLNRILALSKEIRETISEARALRLQARENERAAYEIESRGDISAPDRTKAGELRVEAKGLDAKAAEAQVHYRNLYGELYYLKEDFFAFPHFGEDGQRLYDNINRIQFSSMAGVRGWPHPTRSFDEDGISMGLVMLEKMLGGALDVFSAPTGKRVVRPFPTPDGSTWPNVIIRFTSDFQSQISVGDHTEVRTFIEMGFEDRRKGKRNSKPDQNWEVLRTFAEHGGTFGSTKEASEWRKIEKRVQAINNRLKKLFGFSEKQIVYDWKAKSYRAMLKLIPPPSNEIL